MQEANLSLLRCPVSKSALTLHKISTEIKKFRNSDVEIIQDGILYAAQHWFYPVINGIPRLTVEAFIDYQEFLLKHCPDYSVRRQALEEQFPEVIAKVTKKNKKTKESFSLEWSIYHYDADKTWDADGPAMFSRFLKETKETEASLLTKTIFDAGCGNGYLSQIIATHAEFVVAMDFSNSIERAYHNNVEGNILFIQGDIQFPPVLASYFDIVQCSGILMHTNNTEFSLTCIAPTVKKGGKLSAWLYHPRKDLIHNFFNRIRKYTSKFPLRFQYYLLMSTIFPLSYIVKRLKGNKQNKREMIIDILDWFTPEFRWEHTHDEARSWFRSLDYTSVEITTEDTFGFNITGVRS